MPVAPSSYRRRLKRGGSVEAPTGFWGKLIDQLVRSETIFRLSMCLLAGLVMLVVLQGWRPPLSARPGMVAAHGIVSRVPFEMPYPERTRAAQERAKSLVRVVYAQDKAPIVRVRDGLKNRTAQIASAETLTTQSHAAWKEFAPQTADLAGYLPPPPLPEETAVPQPPVAPAPPAADKAANASAVEAPVGEADVDVSPPPQAPTIPPAIAARVAEAEEAYQGFRSQIDTKEKLLAFEKAIERAFADIERTGVLDKIQHGIDEGSQTEIDVHPIGNPQEMVREQVATVLAGEAKVRLKRRLVEELG